LGGQQAAPTLAADPDLSWPPINLGEGTTGFIIEDAWFLNSAIRVPTPGSQPICTSLDDPECSVPAEELGWWIERVAPPCSEALDWEECVESLDLVEPDGSVIALEYMGKAPGRTFPADPDRGLPTGSTMSLFDDPHSDDPNVGYAVYLGGQMGGRQGPFRLGTVAAQVVHYREVPMGSQPSAGRCLWWGTRCGYRLPFEDGTGFALTFRLDQSVTGWLSGRLDDPTIEVRRATGRLNSVRVTAKPVDVPLVAIAIPDADVTPEIREYWQETFTCPGGVPCTSGVVSGESSGPNSSEQLRLFGAYLNDTATRVIPTWSISSLSFGLTSPCLMDSTRLVGLVTTNATVYDAHPPTFTGGALRYQVAGLHYLPDGVVMEGSYDLVMRSDAARCLYGFSNAPVKAVIQVISEDGTETAATTSVQESSGWLRLSARGFHFSQPTIAVSLSSEEPPSKTIMCKKGKKRKKVTAAEPKCPKGWKLVKRP